MNFLGHFLLAGDSEPIIIGNFIADFVKGKEYQKFPAKIAEGILMHREIDSFTDTHEAFKKTKRRIVDTQGHFSGVVVDVLYDHFLASNFQQYSNQALSGFAQKMYTIIDKNHHQLPHQSKFLFRYMKRDNWLMRYKEKEGIDRTLTGMSKRVKFDNNMHLAIEDLNKHYHAIEQDFFSFIDDIINNFK